MVFISDGNPEGIYCKILFVVDLHIPVRNEAFGLVAEARTPPCDVVISLNEFLAQKKNPAKGLFFFIFMWNMFVTLYDPNVHGCLFLLILLK